MERFYDVGSFARSWKQCTHKEFYWVDIVIHFPNLVHFDTRFTIITVAASDLQADLCRPSFILISVYVLHEKRQPLLLLYHFHWDGLWNMTPSN